MRLSRIVATAAGSVAATLLPKSSTFGDTFATGGGEAGLLADGRDHTYCRGTIGANEWDDAQAAMAYLDDATVMFDTPEGIFCANATDVRYDNGVGIGTNRGQWSCIQAGAPGVCDGNRVQISINNITNDSPAGTVPNNLTKTVRHETGIR